jgi:glutamine cyclotransferase
MNELEYINGTLLANVYLTTKIAVIDLEKGEVKKVLNFEKLVGRA